MIRALEYSDLDEIYRIHAQHFKDEFDMPDFMRYICAFVIEDERGIITSGGVRNIAECVAVTNMDRDPRTRLSALYQLLDASVFVCQKSGHDQMYAWSQNPRYTRRLMRNKFRLPVGQSLILDL